VLPGDVMNAFGATMVVWGGRIASGIVFFSGATLLWPPPPQAQNIPYALGIFLGAMVPLTIGEFIAFYLLVLNTIPKDVKGVVVAKKLQREAIAGIGDAAATIKKIVQATGRSRNS